MSHDHTSQADAHDKDLLNRMNYLIGHLQGVRRMIEKDAYCIDVVTQNLGVVAAIKKVNEKLLASHIDTCVVDAIQGEDVGERQAKLQELHTIMQKM